MSEQTWLTRVGALTRALSGGETQAMLDLLDCTDGHPAQSGGGCRSLARDLTELLKAFPDLRCQAVLLWSDERQCMVRWELEGTHLADLYGLWPSRQTLRADGLAILRAENRLICDAEVHISAASVARFMQTYLPRETV